MKKIGSKPKPVAKLLAMEDEVADSVPKLSSERHSVSMNRTAEIEDENGMAVTAVLKWARKGFHGQDRTKEEILDWLERLKGMGQPKDRVRIINLAIERVEEE